MPAPSLLVRAGTAADLAPVLEIYNHYVERSAATFDVDPVRPEDRVEWIREHTRPGPHRLLLATDEGGRVLGWATTSAFRPRAAYRTTVESSVYCRPDAVTRGVGSSLYAALFESLREEPIERIVAGISLPNPVSVALHLRFGFRPVGTFTRVGWKFGRFWDVAWFERPLRLSAQEDPTAPARRPGTPAVSND